MPQEFTDVLVERRDAILRVQMNRPQKKNALSIEMYHTIRTALETADADPTIQVVYITGTDDSFCAGNDLNSFLLHPESDAAHRFITTISKTATPIVAAVNGVAVGVGVTMLLHCDLVYVSESARFNFAFIDLGVVPEAASTYLLPRLVGQRRAAELLMLGERFGAEKAVALGMANAVVATTDLEKVAWGYAQRLASKPPQALQQTKMLLKRGVSQIVAETIPAESKLFAERMRSDEARAIFQKILGGGK